MSGQILAEGGPKQGVGPNLQQQHVLGDGCGGLREAHMADKALHLQAHAPSGAPERVRRIQHAQQVLKRHALQHTNQQCCAKGVPAWNHRNSLSGRIAWAVHECEGGMEDEGGLTW